jgi:hypothetical protein
MRSFIPYRIKEVGTVQLGATKYTLQYHYPQGGSNYLVYVFTKLDQKGLVFSTDDAFFEWHEKQPKQADLFA